MVPRILERGEKSVTVNCGTTCQKVAQASVGIGGVIVGIPIIATLLFLYGRALYAALIWASGTQCGDERYCDTVLPAMGAFFGTLITAGLIVAVIAVTINTWGDKR